LAAEIAKSREMKNPYSISDTIFVGIAGTPGSGKSYLCESLSKILSKEHFI
jgi:pantothenate kinase